MDAVPNSQLCFHAAGPRGKSRHPIPHTRLTICEDMRRNHLKSNGIHPCSSVIYIYVIYSYMGFNGSTPTGFAEMFWDHDQEVCFQKGCTLRMLAELVPHA